MPARARMSEGAGWFVPAVDRPRAGTIIRRPPRAIGLNHSLRPLQPLDRGEQIARHKMESNPKRKPLNAKNGVQPL